jgi:hypothetical protein
MITKQKLKTYLKEKFEYKHERRASVDAWLIRTVCADTGYSLEESLRDISAHGCGSGCVSGLIYNNDCLRFYSKYEKSIWDAVEDFMDNTGQTLGQFLDSFSSKITDETTLKVWLAWFAVEETAFRLLNFFESD